MRLFKVLSNEADLFFLGSETRCEGAEFNEEAVSVDSWLSC